MPSTRIKPDLAVADLQFRFNRRLRLHAMLPRLLQAMAAGKPSTTAPIRAPDVACQAGPDNLPGKVHDTEHAA